MEKDIVDVQGQRDMRKLAISKVGVKGMAFRSSIKLENEIVPFQGKANCYVYLNENKKGTHMSRMARGITKLIDKEVSIVNLKDLSSELYTNLDTNQLFIDLEGECVRKKSSPVTKYVGYESFLLRFYIEKTTNKFEARCELEIIGTSLCPASKTNSKYGAHNQRSKVIVKFLLNQDTDLSHYIKAIEDSLSACVYPILKLEDEALVTEQAYENPKFVEDIVRDTAGYLNKNNLGFISVDCENFESIHTHNAYAIINNNEGV